MALQRSFGRGKPVGDGLRGQTGFAVVTCQQFRLGGDDLGERGFEDFGNALVVLLARALKSDW